MKMPHQMDLESREVQILSIRWSLIMDGEWTEEDKKLDRELEEELHRIWKEKESSKNDQKLNGTP